MALPVIAFQILAVLSLLDVMTCIPSGLNAAFQTMPALISAGKMAFPVSAS
jgi:hypothetical protein